MDTWRIRSTHVGVYFWYELKHIIRDIDHELDLTILPGIHRSGTSVIFQCLHATDGFQEENQLNLIGDPPTEHRLWRIANYRLAKYLGATVLMPGSVRDKYISDFLVGKVDNDKELKPDIKEEMDEMVGILKWQKLKLIKEPTCQLSLQTWINNYDCFKNAKYIWTRRNYREVAKSLVRLKVADRLQDGKMIQTGYRGVLTVQRAEKLSRYWDSILEKIMPQVNHIEVWHHDLINDTKNTFDRISEFVGAEVNTEAFDLKKVWGDIEVTEPRSED